MRKTSKNIFFVAHSHVKTSFVYRAKEVFFNDIRSLPERVIYLRYDIALRAMIYASRM